MNSADNRSGHQEPLRPFALDPLKICRILFSFIVFLVFMQGVVLLMKHARGDEYVWGLNTLFRMDSEGNVPAAASAFLILQCGLAAFMTGALHPKGHSDQAGWLTLGAVMAFLAFDEAARLHESLGAFMQTHLTFSWLPPTAFLVPYGLAMLILAAILLPWFLRLDRRSQVLFTISGAIYVTGAAGLEIVEIVYFTTPDQPMSLAGDIFITLEETMELSGMGLFLYALLRRLDGVTVSAGSAVAAPSLPTSAIASGATSAS